MQSNNYLWVEIKFVGWNHNSPLSKYTNPDEILIDKFNKRNK